MYHSKRNLLVFEKPYDLPSLVWSDIHVVRTCCIRHFVSLIARPLYVVSRALSSPGSKLWHQQSCLRNIFLPRSSGSFSATVCQVYAGEKLAYVTGDRRSFPASQLLEGFSTSWIRFSTSWTRGSEDDNCHQPQTFLPNLFST